MDMLALMHEGLPYGHLTVGGEAVTDLQLARMVGETPARVRKLLRELEAHGVFSRTDSGVMFSRRMVRDEHIRNVRAEAGKLGGNPNLTGEGKDKAQDNRKDNRLLKQRVKQKATPSSSSSTASANNRTTGAPSGEAPRGLELLPKADCDAAFEKWGASFGAYDYGRFRKELLKAYQAGQPTYTSSELIAAIEAAREWWIEQDDREQGFFTLDRFIAQLAKWIAFGKMPLVLHGEMTERGAWAGSKAIRESSRKPRLSA